MAQLSEGGQPWAMRVDGRLSGDFGFDPLGVQQEADFDLLEAQNKELLTGRLAMVGIAGMVIEELVTHSKLF